MTFSETARPITVPFIHMFSPGCTPLSDLTPCCGTSADVGTCSRRPCSRSRFVRSSSMLPSQTTKKSRSTCTRGELRYAWAFSHTILPKAIPEARVLPQFSRITVSQPRPILTTDLDTSSRLATRILPSSPASSTAASPMAPPRVASTTWSLERESSIQVAIPESMASGPCTTTPYLMGLPHNAGGHHSCGICRRPRRPYEPIKSGEELCIRFSPPFQ